jgi:(p)ppGpp synthase/HD superfamily hydrolase
MDNKEFQISGAKALAIMISVASGAHIGQFDKGDQPYILHPLMVMSLNPNFDWDQKCIAVGHDLIEDTTVSESILREIGFNERVVSGIVAMTKIKGEVYETYKDRVKANRDAVKVKMCDLQHNSDIRRLKGVTQQDLDRIAKYAVFYTELKQLDIKYDTLYFI